MTQDEQRFVDECEMDAVLSRVKRDPVDFLTSVQRYVLFGLMDYECDNPWKGEEIVYAAKSVVQAEIRFHKAVGRVLALRDRK